MAANEGSHLEDKRFVIQVTKYLRRCELTFCENDFKAKKIAYRVHMNPRTKLYAIWRERLPNDPEAIISNKVPDVWEESEKKKSPHGRSNEATTYGAKRT